MQKKIISFKKLKVKIIKKRKDFLKKGEQGRRKKKGRKTGKLHRIAKIQHKYRGL